MLLRPGMLLVSDGWCHIKAHGFVAAALLQIAEMLPAHPDGAAWGGHLRLRNFTAFQNL